MKQMTTAWDAHRYLVYVKQAVLLTLCLLFAMAAQAEAPADASTPYSLTPQPGMLKHILDDGRTVWVTRQQLEQIWATPAEGKVPFTRSDGKTIWVRPEQRDRFLARKAELEQESEAAQRRIEAADRRIEAADRRIEAADRRMEMLDRCRAANPPMKQFIRVWKNAQETLDYAPLLSIETETREAVKILETVCLEVGGIKPEDLAVTRNAVESTYAFVHQQKAKKETGTASKP